MVSKNEGEKFEEDLKSLFQINTLFIDLRMVQQTLMDLKMKM
ncbi:hypothetical protein [Clostridium perfringens]|nr:hypothetical protein [Clostridium perfringens]